MRRILAICGAVVVASGILAGCGGSASESTPQSMTETTTDTTTTETETSTDAGANSGDVDPNVQLMVDTPVPEEATISDPPVEYLSVTEDAAAAAVEPDPVMLNAGDSLDAATAKAAEWESFAYKVMDAMGASGSFSSTGRFNSGQYGVVSSTYFNGSSFDWASAGGDFVLKSACQAAKDVEYTISYKGKDGSYGFLAKGSCATDQATLMHHAFTLSSADQMPESFIIYADEPVPGVVAFAFGPAQ